MPEANNLPGPPAGNPGAIKRYAELKALLSSGLDAMTEIEWAARHRGLFDELREKIQTDAFNLMVVGQFKRGKTCLINALLGADLLPVSVVPLTSIVTILSFGEEPSIRVLFNDGHVMEIQPPELAEYVTEAGNPKNEKDVKEVFVTYPSAYLKDGVRLIDTPGVGSAYMHNTDVAYRYLPKCDAALFLLSVEQPAGSAELDFLRDVSRYSDRIFFLLNKIDILSENEMGESLAFARQVIREVMGAEVKIYPISAREALQGQWEESGERLQKSRLPDFTRVLSGFLLQEKGKVLLRSVTHQLTSILSQCRLEAELELKSLTTPLEELEEKIRAFARKKEDILLEKRSFEAQLEMEMSRLIQGELEQDLASFRRACTEDMERRFEIWYEENRELPLKELDEKLEGLVMAEVERVFSAWRMTEDEKLSSAFGAVCIRFGERIQGVVDALLLFSSQLFSVAFEPVSATAVWTSESSFYFKLKDDPVGLDMLAASLTHVLPGLIHSRFKRLKEYLFRMAYRRIHEKQKERMREMIEMQAGRLRHDFVERLGKSKLELRREMLRKIEATVEGIGKAIENGASQRTMGLEEVERRSAVLQQGISRLDAIREKMLEIRARTEEMGEEVFA